MGWQDAPIEPSSSIGGGASWQDAPIEEEQIVEAPQITEEMPTPSDRGVLESLAGAARKTGEFLGLEKAIDPFARGAARLVTGLEEVPREAIEEAIPEPTKGEYAGGLAQLGSLALPYGTIARGVGGVAARVLPKAAQRLAPAVGTAAAGATGGYAVESGRELQEGKGLGEVLTPGMETAIGAALPVAIPAVAKKILPKSSEFVLNKTVKDNIQKAIKPSQTSLRKPEEYFKKASEGVSTITGYKNNLEFIDVAGNVKVGQLPESVDEFRQAIDQTKKIVFDQYNKLALEAGEAGIRIDTAPIIQELKTVVEKGNLSRSHSEAAKIAKEEIKRLARKRSYTPAEAQEAIAATNKSLTPFFNNPSFADGTKIQVDSLVKNKLDEMLDSAINNLTGKQYKGLKKSYGSLKALEKDVRRRANTLGNKEAQGIVDRLTNISSGAMLAQGLLTFNPATISSGVAAKGLNKLAKRQTDPNRRITKMFNKVDDILTQETSQKVRGGLIEGIKGLEQPKLGARQITTPRFPGDIIAENLRRR